MNTGDLLEDLLGGGMSLKDVESLAVRLDDERREREDVGEYDGPPTERDVCPVSRETWGPATCKTLPVPYSREAA
jgi:hypothetical protein